ncbi:NAD(P)H-binding protein [Nocardia abscessus]|uniref:NAD(P)H-binding protein n=1 Tax=Nocardia abscessus TaxID=120957 RepID=UPI002458FC45|nr:NAD(P)H-binding protein [Nocardia abscessus]
MILVTGATGNVGSELVTQLTRTGQSVKALVRSAEAATLPSGAVAVGGDLDSAESMVAALDGVRAMYLMPGHAQLPRLLELARKAGLERVVLLSNGSAAFTATSNVIARSMADSERAVRESGLDWTMLRARAFMSNSLRWLPQLAVGDVVRVQFPKVALAAIDPADIAAVAARALIDDDLVGEVLDLTGPAALYPADQVDVLAQVLARPLVCRELTDEETRAELAATVPPEYAAAFIDFYIDGTLDESTVYPTVAQVTGRAPRTFTEWATAHANAFRRP